MLRIMTERGIRRKAMLSGKNAEREVCRTLLRMGFRSVKRFVHNSPWDMEVDGQPVEVKSCRGYKSRKHGMKWIFGLRNHPLDTIVPVTAYILCLYNVPRFSGIKYLIVPGPLEDLRYVVTLSSLQGEHLRFVDNWNALHFNAYPLKPRRRVPRVPLFEKGLPSSMPKNIFRIWSLKAWEREKVRREWQESRSR